MITAMAKVLPDEWGRTKHSCQTVTALGVVQFDPGCVDVKAKLIVLTGVVCKK